MKHSSIKQDSKNPIEIEFLSVLDKIRSGEFLDDKLLINAIGDGFGNTDYNLNDNHVILLSEVLQETPHISEVLLYGHNITDIGAKALANVQTLEKLNLSYNCIGPEGVSALSCSNVKTLILRGCIVFKKGQESQFTLMTKSLINNKTITELNLSECWIPDEFMSQLMRLNTTIKSLSLGYNLSDQTFEDISDNTTLERLYISQSSITNESILFISKNMSLKELWISESKITNSVVHLLSHHSSIKTLSLHDSDITFDGAQVFIDSNLDAFNIGTNIKQDLLSHDQCFDIIESFEERRDQKQEGQQESLLSQTTVIPEQEKEASILSLIGSTHEEITD